MFKCHICGSNESYPSPVTQTFQVDGKPVVVENIPASICIRCKEHTFDLSTAEKVRAMIHGKAKPKRTVLTDVFEFAWDCGAD